MNHRRQINHSPVTRLEAFLGIVFMSTIVYSLICLIMNIITIENDTMDEYYLKFGGELPGTHFETWYLHNYVLPRMNFAAAIIWSLQVVVWFIVFKKGFVVVEGWMGTPRQLSVLLVTLTIWGVLAMVWLIIYYESLEMVYFDVYKSEVDTTATMLPENHKRLWRLEHVDLPIMNNIFYVASVAAGLVLVLNYCLN